jgi:hypothetical protein
LVGLVRLVGVLLALVVLTGVATVLVSGLKGRLLQVQLGRDLATVQTIVLDGDRRRAMRRGLYVDFAFLASYWLAFTGLAVLLAHRDGWWRAAAAAAALGAAATMVLDILENIRTFGVLARNRAGDVLTRMQLQELRRSSLSKWGASAVTVALLALLFLHTGRVFWIGVALLVLAAIGVVGLFWNALLGLFMLGLAGAAGFLAVLFLVSPDTVLRGL